MKAAEFFLYVLLLHVSLGYTVLHKGPVGIRLCEQICLNSVDCEIFTFLPVQLMCFKDNLTSSLEEQHVVRRPKKPKILSTANCQFGSVVHKSKSNHLVCRQEKESKLISASLNKLRMKGYKELRKENTLYFYKIYKNKLSWDNAMAHCRQEGGLLAQVQDTFKWDFLSGFLSGAGRLKIPDTGTWVGLRDQQGKGHLVWHDGTGLKHKERMNSFGFFMMFSNANACAVLGPGEKFLWLHKKPCTSNQTFLCEVISKNI